MLVVLFLTAAQVRAAQGYAVLSDDGTTLTFYYGTPSGTYFNTDNTGTNNPGWYSNRANITSVVFDSSFANARPTSCSYWFDGCTKLASITGIEYLNTSDVTKMNHMFNSCSNLQTLDLSHFDTSNVTSMGAMFQDCSSLQTIDLSNFDTSKVNGMNCMFNRCSNLQTLDVSGFNTSKVEDGMKCMFAECSNLQTLDLSNFDTSNVENMSYMFDKCSSLQSIAIDVEKFNTSNVTDMQHMFAWCSNLQTLDVSGFNTSKVSNMIWMFYNCQKLQALDVSNFDTSNVKNMESMFQESGLLFIDVSSFNTKEVTKMGGMFYKCEALNGIKFGKDFDMGASIGNQNDMFFKCNGLRYIDFYASDDTDAITAVNRTWGTFNNVPTTTVIFLPHGSNDVTDVTNVVYSYGGDQTELRCPTYYSEDKKSIEFPHDFKANKAVYKRTMSNTYGSAILPYAFTTNENIQAYIQDWETRYIMHFKDTETVPAHTPFAFKKLADGTTADFTMTDDSNNFGITVKATRSTRPTETTWDGNAGAPYTDSSTAVQVDGWTTRGYYVTQYLDDWADTYYIAGDKFYKADGQITVTPHRVSFHNPNALAAMFSIDITEDEIVTAIKEAELRKDIADAQTIYDAAGRQVSQPQKGLNIIRMADGSVKKVIIK